MFDLLPNQWTPALPLTEFEWHPMPVEVAGEALVLFRDAEDVACALIDRCPHRGAALSLGQVTDAGELQCGYHGWCFRGDGSCARVPLNKPGKRALAKIRATAIPTRELAGAVWVFTGTKPRGEPMLPESLQGPAEEYGTYSQEWDAHWTRAIENFIDFAHPPYLHRETIGAYSHEFAESGGIARVELEETAFGFTTMNYFGGRSFGFQLDWYTPNLSCLHFGPGHELHVFSIPLDAGRTRVMTVRQLPPGTDPVRYAKRAADVDHVILDEDREIVESQPGDVSLARDEISVATDRPTVYFRQWYRDLLSEAGSVRRA
jgi:phenylpropionate dioxygenase-like ring-hydroxylating dioxygenase large terminal subunit